MMYWTKSKKRVWDFINESSPAIECLNTIVQVDKSCVYWVLKSDGFLQFRFPPYNYYTSHKRVSVREFISLIKLRSL